MMVRSSGRLAAARSVNTGSCWLAVGLVWWLWPLRLVAAGVMSRLPFCGSLRIARLGRTLPSCGSLSRRLTFSGGPASWRWRPFVPLPPPCWSCPLMRLLLRGSRRPSRTCFGRPVSLSPLCQAVCLLLRVACLWVSRAAVSLALQEGASPAMVLVLICA